MRLSMNLHPTMGKYDYKFFMDVFASAGVDAIDMMVEDVIKPETALGGENYRDEALNIRREAEKHGLVINQTHAAFHFKDLDDKKNYDNVLMPGIIKSLEVSAIMGADVCVVHPLHYKEYIGHEDEIFEMNMEFYRSLIPYCERFGIKVGVENMVQKDPRRGSHTHDTCSSSAEFVKYIDTLNSPYMVACVDTGHVGLPSMGEEPQDVIRALGHDRLKSLHVHDNDYQKDLHQIPFTGKLDWSEITQALADIDYTGDLTFEIQHRNIIKDDVKYIDIVARYITEIGRYLIAEVERKK